MFGFWAGFHSQEFRIQRFRRIRGDFHIRRISMLSRALGVATAILVMSVAAVPAQAQNLEAGKSPSQIFSGSCAVCHKSPRGLLKTVAPGSLPGFLRQHYTTGTDMASQLAAYVISNGANDPRGGGLTRQGQDLVAPRRPAEARPDGRPAAAPPAAAVAPAPAESPSFFGFGRRPAEPAQEAARPDEAAPMTARQKRAADRAARRLERQNPDAVRPAEVQPPAARRPAVLGEPPVEIEGAPVRPSKKKASKKGRRGQDEAPKAEPVKDEPKVEPKPEPAKPETPKEDAKPVARPVEESKPEAVKPEGRPEPAPSEMRPEPKSESAPATPLRADPVPAVTPAPKPETDSRPAAEPSTAVPATPPSSATTPTPAAPSAPPGDTVPPASR
jgi:hypothetical protein